MAEESWEDAFAQPGSEVGVDFEIPAWVGDLIVGEPTGDSSLGDEPLALRISEMGDGEAATWARDGGWAGFGTRVRAIAEALGGSAELHSYRRGNWERHTIIYSGEGIEV